MRTTKKTASKRAESPRSEAPKPVRKKAKFIRTAGGLTREELVPLIMQAKEAHGYQIALKNIPADTREDDFRRDQVMATVGKAGTSKINRDDYNTVMIRFLELSGKEDEAFERRMKSGVKSYRPTGPDDTHESAAQASWLIQEELKRHATAELAEGADRIYPGWILAAARRRNGKPGLTLENLADRLDAKTLIGLLAHLKNATTVREGRARPESRKPRSKASQKPCEIDSDEPF